MKNGHFTLLNKLLEHYKLPYAYFEAGKFKQKIKITMIDISCKNLLPQEC